MGGNSLCIRGPLTSTAIAALWLRQIGYPGKSLSCHFAAGTDQPDLIPVRFNGASETMRRAVEPLVVKTWPAYLIDTESGPATVVCEVALLDAVQALAELDEQGISTSGPRWGDRWSKGLDVPALDSCIQPARLLTAGWLADLNYPVLYSPDPDEAGLYLQYLPVLPDTVFVRTCSFSEGAEASQDASLALDRLEQTLLQRFVPLLRPLTDESRS